MMVNFLIRLVLTALLVWLIALPVAEENLKYESILGEVEQMGVVPDLLIVAVFLIMVVFYCRTLQKCFRLIKPENRKASPKSVWYMFAVPFNFVEDFFIVINLANSLEAEKHTNKALKSSSDFGMVSGIGWSVAQILSLIPNVVGYVAGLTGIVLVIYHWVLIAGINRLLERNKTEQ